jgi:Flp pilus assembly protein TadD
VSAKSRKEQIQELLALDPEDAFLRYGLGMEHVSEGDDESAVRCFRELVSATPDYVPAYLQTAQALIRLGRTAEARDMLGQGIPVARGQGDAHSAEEMQGFLSGLV